jgi:hypothetical protein
MNKRTLARKIEPVNTGAVTIPLAIPRELLTMVEAPPDTVTQHNVMAVTGITKRTFLELLRRPDAPPVTKIGKLRMVERVVFVGWIRARAGQPERAPSLGDGVDAVLAELGLERMGT